MCQLLVAKFLRLLLIHPTAEWMRRTRDRRHAVVIGDIDDDFSQSREIVACLLHVFAHFGAYFDLRAQ